MSFFKLNRVFIVNKYKRLLWNNYFKAAFMLSGIIHNVSLAILLLQN